jgi:hypothetical protein
LKKDLHEMSRPELEEYLLTQSGIPVPKSGAPQEQWREWFVAHLMIVFTRALKDPEKVRLALIEELGPDDPLLKRALATDAAA